MIRLTERTCKCAASVAAGRAGEGPEAGVSHRSVPGEAPGPGGEQPAGCHRDAAEADAEQPDHRVFLSAGQHGHVSALHGGGQQVRLLLREHFIMKMILFSVLM